MLLRGYLFYTIEHIQIKWNILEAAGRVRVELGQNFVDSMMKTNKIMDINWKDIPGYEGRYSISNMGEVYSHTSNKSMKNTISIDGYEVISLSSGSRKSKRQYKVHRLVMLAFYPICNHKDMVVNHIDGNKRNNNISNLEWTTPIGNNKHALVTGLNRGKNKLKDDQVLDIISEWGKSNLGRWKFSEYICRRYNVSKDCIYSIITGKRWDHLDNHKHEFGY